MPHLTTHVVLGVLFLLASVAVPARAEPVPLYGRFEQAFTAGEGVQPFADLAVRFTAPSGKQVTRPGFYDGGRTYRVRFLATEEGR